MTTITNGFNGIPNQKQIEKLVPSQKQTKSHKIIQKIQYNNSNQVASGGLGRDKQSYEKEVFETIYGEKPNMNSANRIKKKYKKQGSAMSIKKPHSRANSTQKRNIQDMLNVYNKDVNQQ